MLRSVIGEGETVSAYWREEEELERVIRARDMDCLEEEVEVEVGVESTDLIAGERDMVLIWCGGVGGG